MVFGSTLIPGLMVNHTDGFHISTFGGAGFILSSVDNNSFALSANFLFDETPIVVWMIPYLSTLKEIFPFHIFYCRNSV